MQRRGFLEFAARLGAGLGISTSYFGQDVLQALPVAGNHLGDGGLKAPTLVISLDGQWSILTDSKNAGREQNWFRATHPDAQATQVPSIIQETFPAYHGVAWYWRTFEAETHPYAGGRYLLRFNQVNYTAEVWLNGQRLGSHEGADTPFVLDATTFIRPGQTNHLAVRVLNPTYDRIDGIVLDETPLLSSSLSYSNAKGYPIGGILESVDLILTPAIRITDLYVRPDWSTGKVQVRTTLLNALDKASHARLRFVVDGASIGQALVTDAAEAEAKPGATIVDHELEIENHRLWDIRDSYLYRLSVTIETAGVEGLTMHPPVSGFGIFALSMDISG